jgi:CheY-specific phosphatase CheX
MCSKKLPELLGTDAAAVMAEAVSAVAAKSFFAVAERCDDQAFSVLSAGADGWWVVSVQFTEGDGSGVVSCTVADDLAFALFDAFTGRDPLEPPADPTDLVDLLGEFANMVGGTWLTRLANHQTFTLSSPTVQRASSLTPASGADTRVLLSVNDRPLAVDVRIATPANRPVAPVGA